MSERIRANYDDVLYKSTYTLLYTLLPAAADECACPAHAADECILCREG